MAGCARGFADCFGGGAAEQTAIRGTVRPSPMHRRMPRSPIPDLGLPDVSVRRLYPSTLLHIGNVLLRWFGWDIVLSPGI